MLHFLVYLLPNFEIVLFLFWGEQASYLYAEQVC